MTDQMRRALLRAALTGALTFATAAVAALLPLVSNPTAHALLVAAASMLAVLGGRGLIEGAIDRGRAARGELVERPPT